jgi:oligoendopeptidase F
MPPSAPSPEDLPRWELESRFGFPSPFSEDLDTHLEKTKTLAKAFREKYEGKLESADAAAASGNGCSLLEAIQEYEEIASRRGLIASYLSLSYDVKLNDDALKKRKGALSQNMSAIVGDYLEWFTLDVASLSQEILEQHYQATPELTKYKSFLDELLRQKPHDLSKDVERALTVRSPYTGTRPVVSFLDKELSLIKFDLDGEGKPTVNMEVLLSRLSSSKDTAVRAKCLKTLNEGLNESITRVAALSLSSVSGSWLIENKERNYATLRSRRNLDNNCPDNVVESLLSGVQSQGVLLCKRYYGLKKKILQDTQGLQKFTWSDRNAPIDIGGTAEEEEKISWETAVEMVERGYRKFSPHMADLFVGMVKEKRIDVPAIDHKKGGAYCAGVIPGVGPFQLLNFDGTKNDVATLAHESGHGCHDILAYKQGYLQYHPPLTLAETGKYR